MELSRKNVLETIKANKVLVLIISLALLCLVLAIIYISLTLSNQNIYPNIKVAGVDIGGLTKESALDKLNKKFNESDVGGIAIKYEGKKESIQYKELNLFFNTSKAVETAYNIGREGNKVLNVFNIIGAEIKGKNIDMEYTYDKDKLIRVCEKLETAIRIEPKDDDFSVKNNILTFTYGYPGRGLDKDKVISQVEEKMKKLEDVEVAALVTDIGYKKLDAESLPTEPKDATYKVENYRTIVYIKEQPGIILDKGQFTQLLNDNSSSKKSFTIPVKATLAKVTIEDLKAKMFKNTLASHQTYYGNSPDNRKANVKLAASKIENIILGPGDEFSYNKIVGPRTENAGFKKAHVYSNGKIIDDFGGGICQVSTTLYNAVIKIDLQITERKNHMFTVAYAQPGMDATVSYGIDDFKFKNNMNYPIKIINTTTGTNVGFTILGTAQNPGKTVEFRRETLKTIPFTTKEIIDPNLEEGQTKVDQSGMEGYVVNVYKIIKQDGKFVSEQFLHKDTYRTLEKIVRVGSKPKTTSDTTTTAGQSQGQSTTEPETKPRDEPTIDTNLPEEQIR